MLVLYAAVSIMSSGEEAKKETDLVRFDKLTKVKQNFQQKYLDCLGGGRRGRHPLVAAVEGGPGAVGGHGGRRAHIHGGFRNGAAGIQANRHNN